jgi:predicted enzyme related to lactoylglutathione lyase
MSALRTSDPEAATRFYGAVFGWETESFGPATMWRLPGYVGGEPTQPVPRDVVAVMLPADDVAPHWGVDFWVHDADATAARAVELGGSVPVPPYDAPPFRQAVVADRQGAVLSVSELTAGR